MNNVVVSKASIWDTGKLNIFLFIHKELERYFALRRRKLWMTGENCKQRSFIIFTLTNYY